MNKLSFSVRLIHGITIIKIKWNLIMNDEFILKSLKYLILFVDSIKIKYDYGIILINL